MGFFQVSKKKKNRRPQPRGEGTSDVKNVLAKSGCQRKEYLKYISHMLTS